MPADRRRPDASAVSVPSNHAVARIHLHALDDMSRDRPMNKIGRSKDGNARDKMKCRSNEVIVRAIANNIRIGVVREKNRISISPPRNRHPGRRQHGCRCNPKKYRGEQRLGKSCFQSAHRSRARQSVKLFHARRYDTHLQRARLRLSGQTLRVNVSPRAWPEKDLPCADLPRRQASGKAGRCADRLQCRRSDRLYW
jgi:hypothetical protein